MRWSKIWLCGWIVLAAAVAASGCGDEGECADGTCVCEAGEECAFECEAPPCNLTCEGDNPSCEGPCANGTCACGDGASCDFTCQAPPCHVECGDGASCEGACANGECTCGKGSSCAFTCGAPPCHVTCDGDNPACTGTCANGTCTCGPGSTCEFACESGPCHVNCADGAACVVLCPNGGAGTQDCDITECAAGEITICPDMTATTCGAPCPPPPP